MAIGQPLRPTTRMLKYILAKMNSSQRMRYYYFVIDTKLVKLESTTDLKNLGLSGIFYYVPYQMSIQKNAKIINLVSGFELMTYTL